MKINVNEYNEILSYEGTPVELAEFISLGVFGEWVPVDDMVDCGYEEDYEDEDCDCEDEDVPTPEPVEVVIEEAKEEPVVEVNVDEPVNEPFDVKKHKESIRKEIRKIYPDLSNEEFDRYYNLVADWVNVFDNLEFLKY